VRTRSPFARNTLTLTRAARGRATVKLSAPEVGLGTGGPSSKSLTSPEPPTPAGEAMVVSLWCALLVHTAAPVVSP